MSALVSISCAAVLDQFPFVAGTEVQQLKPLCSFLDLFAPVHAQDGKSEAQLTGCSMQHF
jgi:hypothetical protein